MFCSADKRSGQGAAPGFAGLQHGGGCLIFPPDAAVLRAGQAVPGFNADELRHTGLAPQQGVGELFDVADHTAAGALFVQAQGSGLQIHHAMAVVGKQLLIHRAIGWFSAASGLGRQTIFPLWHLLCAPFSPSVIA